MKLYRVHLQANAVCEIEAESIEAARTAERALWDEALADNAYTLDTITIEEAEEEES
jgi:ribosomal protein L16/L10AE